MAENKITLQPLIDNMIEKLKAWNKNKVVLTGQTVHKEVLSTESEFQGIPPSKQTYADAISNTVWQNGGTFFEWPSDFMDKTVEEVANFIISKQVYQ